MDISKDIDAVIDELKRLKSLIDSEKDDEKRYYYECEFEKKYIEFDDILKNLIEKTKKR